MQAAPSGSQFEKEKGDLYESKSYIPHRDHCRRGRGRSACREDIAEAVKAAQSLKTVSGYFSARLMLNSPVTDPRDLVCHDQVKGLPAPNK